MELYEILDNFRKHDYVFQDDVLNNYKDSNKLVWYSDCYYNSEDGWSSITLQNDFVILIYQQLMSKNRIRSKKEIIFGLF